MSRIINILIIMLALDFTASADITTFRDGFEAYPDGTITPNGWLRAGGSHMSGNVATDSRSLTGKNVYRCHRKQNGPNTYVTLKGLKSIRHNVESGIYELTASVYITGKPYGIGTASSWFETAFIDVNKKMVSGIRLSDTRYHGKRKLEFRNGATMDSEDFAYPLDTWITITQAVNEITGKWDFTIEAGGKVLISKSGLSLGANSDGKVSSIQIGSGPNRNNDRVDNLIDDISVTFLSKAKPVRSVAKKKNPNVEFRKISSQTEPRHYRQVNKNFYNSAFITWGGDNVSDRLSLADPKLANKRAKSFSDMGITGVLYNGRHFRWNFADEWDQIKHNARIVSDACHRYGIMIVEHHDSTIFTYRGYPIMLKHLDWLQKDVRTGEPTRWACPSNDDFIKSYSQYLRDYQKHSNVDGYMLDELTFMNPFVCGCKYCRAAYKRASGTEIPEWIDSESRRHDPNYKNWQHWRSIAYHEAHNKLMDAIRQEKPDAVSMTYCSTYTDPRRTNRNSTNLTLTPAFHSSFVGWENMNSEALNGWIPYLRGLKLRMSMGNYYDIPMWSLNRELTTKEAVYFGWALCQLGKHSVWYGLRGISTDEEIQFFKRYSTWKGYMPHRYARCLTDTGFLISNQTRAMSADRGFAWYDCMGWADAQLEANSQFDALLDGDLELPDRLGKYKVLILASQACLTDKQCENIVKWVKDGGTLIFTANTSLYDESGNKRSDFGFGKSTGISFIKRVKGKFNIKGKIDNKSVSFDTRDAFFKVKILDTRKSKVLAVAKEGKGKSQPAVVETKFGKGRFIYLATKLNYLDVETEMRNGYICKSLKDAKIQTALRSLIAYAHETDAPAILDFPQGITGTAYQLQGGNEAGTIYVHILNTQGKNIKKGYKAVYGRPEKIILPPVNRPLVICLAGNVTGPVYVESPELTEKIMIKSVKSENGKTQISIPGKYLKTYLQVKIPAEKIKGQVIQPVPLAKKIKEAVK